MSDQEVTRLQEQIKTLFASQTRIEKAQEDFEKESRATVNEIYTEIKALKDQFANRLPVWATMLIGFLMAALGWFAGR